MQEVLVNRLYRHYKGNVYKVIALGKHSETCEDMVVYQSVINGEVWCRPAGMWFDTVADGVARFSLLDD